jgi:hypothetical protein
MDKLESGKIMAALAAAYPRFVADESTHVVWHEMLSDLDYYVVSLAVKQCILQNTFPPAISEVRKAAVRIMYPQRSTAAEAWEDVNRALDKYGYYRPSEGMASLSPLAARAVRAIGWTRMCLSQNLSVERGQFMRIYDEMRERQDAEQLLPEAMKAQIAAVVAKPALKEGRTMSHGPGYDKAS